MAQSYCGIMVSFLKRMWRIVNQPVKSVFVNTVNAEKLRRRILKSPKESRLRLIEAEMRRAGSDYLPYLENVRSLLIEPVNIKARRAMQKVGSIIATHLDVIAIAPPLRKISYPIPGFNKVQFVADMWRFIRNERRKHLVMILENKTYRHDRVWSPKLRIWSLILKAQKIRFLATMGGYQFKEPAAEFELTTIDKKLNKIYKPKTLREFAERLLKEAPTRRGRLYGFDAVEVYSAIADVFQKDKSLADKSVVVRANRRLKEITTVRK